MISVQTGVFESVKNLNTFLSKNTGIDRSDILGIESQIIDGEPKLVVYFVIDEADPISETDLNIG